MCSCCWMILILLTLFVFKYSFLEYSFLIAFLEAASSLLDASASDQQMNIKDPRNYCIGTDNGRSAVTIDNSIGHYSRLKASFMNCRRIVGNLELTHITKSSISAEINNTKDAELAATIRQNPFFFLSEVEEITGYLLIYNVQVELISLPRLKIIWGEQTNEGNALQVDSSSLLRILSLPALRTIEEGNVMVRRSPELCYMDPSRQLVDYSEILGEAFEKRLQIDSRSFKPHCKEKIKGCHLSCGNKPSSCFGPKPDQCQTVYRRDCRHCESQSCYRDEQGALRCCDNSCTGGCFGDGRDKCIACKRYEQDGKCVSECSGTHFYHPKSMVKGELPEEEKRYFYGRHCVKECPPGTLIEEHYCVTRCSEGHYRDANRDDQRCVPCQGKCPKVCQIDEPINSVNIHDLVGCSEIEGNLIILSGAFLEHSVADLPPMPAINQTVEVIKIPALNANDLNVLKSVKIITGYLAIEGGQSHTAIRPNSLGFLENLELIEGRKLYHERFSLYVMGNYELRSLGLRSLKRIKSGAVHIQNNRNLCYSYSIPFDRLFGLNGSLWKGNRNPEECEFSNRKCDSTCEPSLGCWGHGPTMCVQCRNFTRDGQCADHCPEQGFFVPKDEPKSCLRCHDQCLECTGTGAENCVRCRNFEYWSAETPRDRDSYHHVEAGNQLKCVAKCPNSTYISGNVCKLCHKACYEGCQGPGDWLDHGGCDSCRFGVREKHRIRCLVGEMEEDVCRNNGLGENYFLSIYKQNNVKYMCRKCRPECKSCRRDSSFVKDDCECAHFRLMFANESLSHEIQGKTLSDVCVNSCGRGSYILANKSDDGRTHGLCRKCHYLCDDHGSCDGPTKFDCHKCALAGRKINDTIIECLEQCPTDMPFPYEGMCHTENKEAIAKRTRNMVVGAALFTTMLVSGIIGYLIYRCTTYRKKYIKEAQMHLPEIPPIDPRKIGNLPNMRRFNLIGEDDIVYSKNAILGSGAFGIVYAGKYKLPGKNDLKIPVAIKEINRSAAEDKHSNEQEMLREAGLMAQVQHEHLLPFVGIGLKGGLKIVTLLRPIGSLLRYLEDKKDALTSQCLILYCYQIAKAMEYLSERGIVHRDLAARNVLVRNEKHVEVTDFGLAAMLQDSAESTIVRKGRVAVRWLAIESLRDQIYNEKTDVWAFGVTCWEIVMFGQQPYREIPLTGILPFLEKGERLPEPLNTSLEFRKELFNCWVECPKSRPSFKALRETFKDFCSSPHLHVLERKLTQRLASISDYDQRMMIENLLKDSDFLDPTNLDPAEYMPATPRTVLTELSFAVSTPNTCCGNIPQTPSVIPATPSVLGGRDSLILMQSARFRSKLKRETKLISIESVEEENDGLVCGDENEAAGHESSIDEGRAKQERNLNRQESIQAQNNNYINECDFDDGGEAYVNQQQSNSYGETSGSSRRKKGIPGKAEADEFVEVDLITLSPLPSLVLSSTTASDNSFLLAPPPEKVPNTSTVVYQHCVRRHSEKANKNGGRTIILEKETCF